MVLGAWALAPCVIMPVDLCRRCKTQTSSRPDDGAPPAGPRGAVPRQARQAAGSALVRSHGLHEGKAARPHSRMLAWAHACAHSWQWLPSAGLVAVLLLCASCSTARSWACSAVHAAGLGLIPIPTPMRVCATLQASMPEHTVIESKPDTQVSAACTRRSFATVYPLCPCTAHTCLPAYLPHPCSRVSPPPPLAAALPGGRPAPGARVAGAAGLCGVVRPGGDGRRSVQARALW